MYQLCAVWAYMLKSGRNEECVVVASYKLHIRFSLIFA